jgi:tetratricopeptide (TPR) repeat protein
MMNRRLLLVGCILLASCSGGNRARLTPLERELSGRIAEADSLRQKADFVSLKNAFQIYEDAYNQPGLRTRTAAPLAATALLLAVREKELGIADRTYMDKALEIIGRNPDLGSLSPYAEIAGFFWVQGRGTMRDIDERFSWKDTEEKLKRSEGELREKARTDEFCAYMYLVLRCAYANPYGLMDELAEVSAAYPDSLLLKYKLAICPEKKTDLLETILAENPRFYEAAYFLGEEALLQGHLLKAERYLLSAYEGIQESPQITISLATVAFGTEEFGRSLGYFEKTLELSPDYRDALLGKAVCLSYLGRPEEAIRVCRRIIGLGFWLIGESFYWMAWNQHELKDNVAAMESVEQAKGRLPTSTEVFTLSGTIALENGDLVKAEKDLKEALEYDPANGEAMLQLGNLYVLKKDWPSSAVSFEKAAFFYQEAAADMEAKIADLKKSELAAERKDRLLRRKARQLERTILTEATAFYNAAAGYFNSGQKYKALELAARAAEHPAFQTKAAELMEGIKQP